MIKSVVAVVEDEDGLVAVEGTSHSTITPAPEANFWRDAEVFTELTPMV